MKSQNGNVEYLYDKYVYIIKNVWTVYALYTIGIAAWLMTVYGYILFFQVEPIYGYILGPIVLLYTLYYLINYGLNFFYKKFDITKHNTRIGRYWASQTEIVWGGGSNPSVDIFVTVCGEDATVIEKTLRSVSRISYENKKVYVLDDI